MNSGKPAPSTSGRTVAGKMVDANAAAIAAGSAPPPPAGAPVRSVAPANAAKNVPVGANVSANFSEAMDEASVEAAGAFTLRKRGQTARVAARVTYDPARKRATLNPTAALEPRTTYTAVLKGGLSSARKASATPAKDKVWSFTTGVSPSSDRPKITQRSPRGSTRDNTPTIEATVRDAQSDLSAENIELFVDGEQVEARYDAEENRLSYTPSKALAKGKHEVKIMATDAGGATGSRTWNFKVGRADNAKWWERMDWWKGGN
ncbi:Ig-like domain-containing protein [Rubrobacter marinus]|nr:Ig-like domain-containing protein [Rubrobacter marinus]